MLGYCCSLLRSLLSGINVTSPGNLCLFMMDKICAAVLSESTKMWKSLQSKDKYLWNQFLKEGEGLVQGSNLSKKGMSSGFLTIRNTWNMPKSVGCWKEIENVSQPLTFSYGARCSDLIITELESWTRSTGSRPCFPSPKCYSSTKFISS